MRKTDWHIHSDFSDGQLSVEEIVRKAQKLGLQSIAITDHFDPYDRSLRNRTAGEDELLRHFDRIRRAGSSSSIEVFAGIETGSDMDGSMRLSERILSQCDIVICSPHYLDLEKEGRSVFDAEYWSHYKALLLKQASNAGDVLGHPEGYLPAPGLEGTTFAQRQEIRAEIAEKFLDEAFYRQLGTLLAESGKAFELHGASGTPRQWVVELLADLGVCFSIGSDAHDEAFLGKNDRAWRLAEEKELKIKNPLGKRRFEICKESR